MKLLNVSRFKSSNRNDHTCEYCGNKIGHDEDQYSLKGNGIFCSAECTRESSLRFASIGEVENNIFRHDSNGVDIYRLMGR